MNVQEELTYHLRQGPQTIKQLVRLTGRTDSGIRKAIGGIAGVVEDKSAEGHKTFALPPQSQGATKALVAAGVGTKDRPAPVKPKADAVKPKAKPTVKPKADVIDTKRGRKASYAGKRLFPAASLLKGDSEPKTYQNPRRVGSHGYKSLKIIIGHPGITTEEFVMRGGRLNDLRWDVAHGHVKAE